MSNHLNSHPSRRRNPSPDEEGNDHGIPRIIEGIEVEIDERAVLRRLGARAQNVPMSPRLDFLLKEEWRRGERLISPRGAIRHLDIELRQAQRVGFAGDDFIIESRNVAHLLRNSLRASLLVVTIGQQLEGHVETFFAHDKIVRGYLLDAIGSEAVEAAAQIVQETIEQEAFEQGCSLTPRFSPGYGDWNLSAQPEIIRLTNGQKIGISVNQRFMMIPRKSISAIVGWRTVSENHCKMSN